MAKSNIIKQDDADGVECLESEYVAIKVLDLNRIKRKQSSLKNLIAEIKVHWVLEKCDGMLGLQEIYEDMENIYLVLDY